MADFTAVFSALRPILARHGALLSVKADTPAEFTVVTKTASPFPQHKGQPLFFASVRSGKAYVSFHLLPLYMNPALANGISPALKKRMQGKACFNFKTEPPEDLVAELNRLTDAAVKEWAGKKWM